MQIRHLGLVGLIVLGLAQAPLKAAVWNQPYGGGTPYAVPADYDGDGVADFAVWYPDLPGGATWCIWYSETGKHIALPFGWYGPEPVPGDYDGDGRTDIGLYDAPGGMWYLLQSSDGFQQAGFGWWATDPVPADYDGDSRTDRAVYLPADGSWFISGSGDGFIPRSFGWWEVEPVPADYDGDGSADQAVHHRDTGAWYILGSSNGFQMVMFGFSEALPVPADYDGDGICDQAVYWPRYGTWYLRQSRDGFRELQLGGPGLLPVPADYGGNGAANPAVYDPHSGAWQIDIRLGALTVDSDMAPVSLQGPHTVLGQYEDGVRVDWSVDSPVTNDSTFRAEAIPASGSFVMSGDHVLHVNWDTDYWLAVTQDGNGVVSPGSGWYDAGAVVPMSYTEAADSQFVEWFVDDVSQRDSGGNPLQSLAVTMNQHHAIRAVFEYVPGQDPDEDGDGLPDSWEEEHFGTTTTHSATNDPDADGWSNLTEYRRGGNPLAPWLSDTNSTTRLRILTPLR